MFVLLHPGLEVNISDFKLHEGPSSSNINFSKSQALGVGTCKNKTDKPGQMAWSQFSINTLGVNFGNSALDNSNRDKINETLTKKKSIFVTERNSLRELK